ncbi:MAG TPA: amino acid permease [Cyanobacteria bacterium UBA8530]|nr:amino acid permease [Cyanobacteria bacterium UBA8530]
MDLLGTGELRGTGNLEAGLKRVLGAFDLTLLGVGAIIGTGIFVITGPAAAFKAGPAIVLSFLLAGIACAFAALCYAELAAMIPLSGSAYTYAYAAFGEIVAWVIGWDLILEYIVASSAVAIGWSGYFNNMLKGIGLAIPVALTGAPNLANGTFVNLPAILITLIVTAVLVAGIKESSNTAGFFVALKLTVLVLFLVVGSTGIKVSNWSPFLPFGWMGVLSGAAIIFFAFIGFDALSTVAEEVKNPQKNLPIGIIASLVICTLFYILVAIVLTGMMPYHQLGTEAALATALYATGHNWTAALLSVGAIAGITSVLLVMLMGQPRIFFAMARDGLFPKIFAGVHPKFQTPWLATIITGGCVSVLAGFTPISVVAELANIGTLFAFVLVSLGVVYLRMTMPNAPRPFKVPFSPVIPILSAACCFFLMCGLPHLTWIRFAIWTVLGLFIYFGYGIRHSRINQIKA